MDPLLHVKQTFPKHASLIEAFASLHKGIMILLDKEERVIGANQALLEFLGVNSADALSHDIFCGDLDVIDTSKKHWAHDHLKQDGLNIGLQNSANEKSSFGVMIDVADIEGERLYILLLEDNSNIQKAIRAHHYFEIFKRKFLTSISHEFRTPMNGILGFIKLLENSVLTKKQRHQVLMIDESATEMMRKIENLLEMMQLDSGAITLKETVYKPMTGMDEFFLKFYESAQKKNITLFCRVDSNMPRSMVGDPGKVKRVLESLISNAIKFTHEGGQILVELKVLEEKDGFIEVEYSVLDSGEGIPHKRLAHILRPFASAQENQKLGKNGLGIGLSVSHKYLAMMHSKLSVASEVGQGSKFFFRLTHRVNEPSQPLTFDNARIAVASFSALDHQYAKCVASYLEDFGVTVIQTTLIDKEELEAVDALFIISEDLKDERIASVRNILGDDIKIVSILTKQRKSVSISSVHNVIETLEFPMLPNKIENVLSHIYLNQALTQKKELDDTQQNRQFKILLAEDNRINLELLQTILNLQNYDVTAVEHGEAALEAYMKEPYDLVLTDIDMPVMDGIVATRLMREVDKKENRGKTPMIALTAYALEGDRERIMNAGLDAHIPKPVDKPYLLEVIKYFLNKQQKSNIK